MNVIDLEEQMCGYGLQFLQTCREIPNGIDEGEKRFRLLTGSSKADQGYVWHDLLLDRMCFSDHSADGAMHDPDKIGHPLDTDDGPSYFDEAAIQRQGHFVLDDIRRNNKRLSGSVRIPILSLARNQVRGSFCYMSFFHFYRARTPEILKRYPIRAQLRENIWVTIQIDDERPTAS